MPLLLLLVAAGVLMTIGVGAVIAARGRRQVFEQVKAEVLAQFGDVRAADIVAAQAVLETGGGATPAWQKGWNFGNVTAGASWHGPVVEGGDLEYTADGTSSKRIVQRFRAYTDLRAAVADFLALLSWSKYRDALAALSRGDATGYASELRKGGYYTAPLAEYQGGIARALADYA